ncbi:sensor histidine kinase N-terminal domain-containing protein [Bosea sp. TND4EK4]|uniref:histidine kinase dimerization/phospho-acceptor domain-containing protein n=1 Tax=Bosea sp. TND4EK4 TaxID=1907408 RepID=UPI000954E74D|nr:sensor histidine kinase N-terminal domain-containing protein [Bosea sp. TND4EK4]SIR27490.1 two-component system, OmpR family, sensor histidine kinase QseC [Bosea sp. TND4EK4]
MTSLRARLFVILVATTGLIWLAATAWIYLGTKAELERVLDTRLQEAARMVSSLVRDAGGSAPSAIAATPQVSTDDHGGYERQLSCQIWSLGGRLVAASTAAPAERLANHAAGFNDSMINGELWRVYAIEDAAKDVRVLVGDRLGLRDRLVNDLVMGLVAPTLLMLPIFAGLIWISVGRGLSPLRGIAGDLQQRAADDLAPLQARVIDEIRPVTDALNGLFTRLDAARRHEREFTAFAAHELRTPLAGIRTQAQIARAADTTEMRTAALDHIMQGVDRTARLISQLLALARLESGADPHRRERVNLGQLLREIDREGQRPASISVEFDDAIDAITVEGDRDNLKLALRNLHENACGHSHPGGRVRWLRTAEATLAVDDEGPGVPADELALIRQRFYRGRAARNAGSGLGLAIVEVALHNVGAELTLGTPPSGRGLRAAVSFVRSA